MIKALEIDVEGIEQNGIIADIGNNLKLDLIYNNVDSYIYVSILDSDENRITGFFRLVPDINFLSLVRIEKFLQLCYCRFDLFFLKVGNLFHLKIK